MSLDHVVLRDSTCVCLRCGATYEINMPASIPVFTAILEAFAEDHKKCPAEKGEP